MDTLVILDAGTLPPAGFDQHRHAGALAFELSCGRERLVVNCGAAIGQDASWKLAQQSTAAHSTVAVDDTNSSDITPGASRHATIIERARETVDGNTWASASHDGYLANLGLTHRRRLYLSADGAELRGEDTLIGPHHGQYIARFHLHPDVDASLVQNGAAALLRLPSGAAWRFEARGGTLSLAESIYLGDPAKGMRRTEQIALAAPLVGGGGQIKWAFRRIAPRQAERGPQSSSSVGSV